MVCDEDVCDKDVCDKDGVFQMVYDKDVCDKWCKTKMFVKDGV